MSSTPDDHRRRMIGLPSTYRTNARRTAPESEYDAYLAQMAASGIPSSTMPSAANSAGRSLEQHPNASTLDNGNAHFGVFEPPVGHQPRSYSSFAPLLGDQAQQQQQQQVPGEFVPGNGGGIYQRNPTARPHLPVNTQSMPMHDVSRSSTTMSGYSDPSSSANLSPVRTAPTGGFNQYASPPDYGRGYVYPNTSHTLEYPSSGSDPFPTSSDQYTSPSHMSSPEQMHVGHSHPHQQQPQRTSTNIFAATNPVYGASPTRPGPVPYGAGAGGAGGAWQTVDNTASLGPASSLAPNVSGNGSSGGSHSSGGGGRGPFSGGSSGGSAGVGRSNSFGAGNANRHHLPGHAHSQSRDGLLAVPHPAQKRQRRQEEEEESDSDDEVGPRGAQHSNAAKRLPGACSNCKRLKMKCVFANPHVCQRCQNTNKTCVVEGRKQRQGPNKRELLMRELANKDQIIDSLLRQIHNPAMRTPINFPPNMPIPQQTTNTSERPPDKDVLAWIESIRQNRPPTPTGSIDTGAVHRRAQSEPVLPPPPPTEPDEDAVSFGESASNVRQRAGDSPDAGRPRTPIELRQDSAELDDKLHSIPPPNAPVGFIAKLALTTNRDKRGSDAGMTGEAEEEDKWVGVGNMTYFEAGPSADPELRRIIIERQMPPEILTHGIIKPAEVEVLFKIFFEQLNPFVAILDPSMHTPAFVFGRCPFLFTAICAISSRYYRKRPELYTIAMHFAKQSAATALIDGWKSVELVQAYILMSVYPVPARRWEEDRTWLYLGLAIRMATDLNLHLPWQGKASGEAHEREILNRTRTWLICFNLDRSGATQFGRPPTIREDYIIRKSQDWYRRSKYNLSMDVHLTAYTRLLRIVARFLANVYSDANSPTALNKSLDFMSVTTASDEELMTYERETKEQFEKESDPNDSACAYRCNLLPYLSNYSRLVIFSFGYQQAFQRGLQHGKVFFDKCYKAASEVVRIATDVLAPSGRLMYSPDGHFVFISFAAAFLLKMLRPQFAAALEPTQSSRIIQIVTRLADVLASDKVAIDDRHSPRLYSRFLSGLIAKQNQNGLVLSKPLGVGPKGGAGGGGSSGSASSKPARDGRSAGGASTSGTSGAGLTSNTSTSAKATDAGMMHESPHMAPIDLGSEADESRDKVSSPPRPRRMQSPPIVIRPPTIDQSMQNPNRTGELSSPQRGLRQATNGGQEQTLMGGYVTVEPTGETLSSVESTAQGGETTITDASGGDMEYDKHDMLAAMYALQDPNWLDNFLMPGFNANYADDGSNSSSEMRQWYNMNQGAILPGGGTGQGTMGALGAGHGMQGLNHPDLFAPGLDYTQNMMANGHDTPMDNMMDGYGYR